MTEDLNAQMQAATRLTRMGKLGEAVAVIQRLLGNRRAAPGDAAPTGPTGPTIDGLVDHGVAAFLRAVPAWTPPPAHAPETATEPASNPGEGTFTDGRFATATGARPCKLFVPAHAGARRPLIVMLHGCTQSPDDFAAGTRMNDLAGAQGCFVLYPEQIATANAQRCWNWFAAANQERDRGEAALIAGMTRAVIEEHGIDPARVYVAGLSAGGAAAAIMGAAYPDLYAAIGVHSGLACGAARDMPSAFAAMRDGADGAAIAHAGGWVVPTIIFHGDRDGTVHPRNGDAVAAQAVPAGDLPTDTRQGQVPGGHRYTRTVRRNAGGTEVLEKWVIHGADHAWSGGSRDGSYTDPLGPDASREMLRFFLSHRNRRPAA